MLGGPRNRPTSLEICELISHHNLNRSVIILDNDSASLLRWTDFTQVMMDHPSVVRIIDINQLNLFANDGNNAESAVFIVSGELSHFQQEIVRNITLYQLNRVIICSSIPMEYVKSGDSNYSKQIEKIQMLCLNQSVSISIEYLPSLMYHFMLSESLDRLDSGSNFSNRLQICLLNPSWDVAEIGSPSCGKIFPVHMKEDDANVQETRSPDSRSPDNGLSPVVRERLKALSSVVKNCVKDGFNMNVNDDVYYAGSTSRLVGNTVLTLLRQPIPKQQSPPNPIPSTPGCLVFVDRFIDMAAPLSLPSEADTDTSRSLHSSSFAERMSYSMQRIPSSVCSVPFPEPLCVMSSLFGSAINSDHLSAAHSVNRVKSSFSFLSDNAVVEPSNSDKQAQFCLNWSESSLPDVCCRNTTGLCNYQAMPSMISSIDRSADREVQDWSVELQSMMFVSSEVECHQRLYEILRKIIAERLNVPLPAQRKRGPGSEIASLLSCIVGFDAAIAVDVMALQSERASKYTEIVQLSLLLIDLFQRTSIIKPTTFDELAAYLAQQDSFLKESKINSWEFDLGESVPLMQQAVLSRCLNETTALIREKQGLDGFQTKLLDSLMLVVRCCSILGTVIDGESSANFVVATVAHVQSGIESNHVSCRRYDHYSNSLRCVFGNEVAEAFSSNTEINGRLISSIVSDRTRDILQLASSWSQMRKTFSDESCRILIESGLYVCILCSFLKKLLLGQQHPDLRKCSTALEMIHKAGLSIVKSGWNMLSNIVSRQPSPDKQPALGSESSESWKTIVLFVVGGISWTEIRQVENLLKRDKTGQIRVILMSTHVCTREDTLFMLFRT